MDINFPQVRLSDHITGWDDRSLQNNASYRRNITIINCLPFDICVATRDGLRFSMPRRSIMNENRFIIRVETHIENSIKKQLVDLMSRSDLENSPELQIAKNYWSNINSCPVTGYNSDVIRVEYSVPLSLIKKFGGRIYVRDIDYLIGLGPITDDFIHSESNAGEIIRGNCSNKDNESQNKITSNTNFIRSIKIIDNEGVVGNRFVKVGNDIYVIKPRREQGISSGIYILTNKPVQNELQDSELIAERYDLGTENPYFKLYSSYSEAANDEVSAEVRKAELAIQELKTREEETRNRTQRAILENERLVTERDNFQKELEVSNIKHLNELEYLRNKIEVMHQERESAKIREEEERKSIRRKGTIDLIKAIPVIITATIGLHAFYKKITTPSAPKA